MRDPSDTIRYDTIEEFNVDSKAEYTDGRARMTKDEERVLPVE